MELENKPEEFQMPEIWETEDEKYLLIGQLKNKYLQFAKQRFQGVIFINKETKKPIKVSRDGINEWWKKTRKREHIISMQLLDYFIENGKFTGENTDYLGRRRIISASKFESICKVNGKLCHVTLTTRKAIYDTDKLRYFSLKEL
jgi:hypothetical protein